MEISVFMGFERMSVLYQTQKRLSDDLQAIGYPNDNPVNLRRAYKNLDDALKKQ